MCPKIFSQCLRSTHWTVTLFILWTSAMQNHPTLKNTCLAIIYPSSYTFFFVSFSRLSIGGHPYYTSSKFTSSSVLNSRWSLWWSQCLTIRIDFPGMTRSNINHSLRCSWLWHTQVNWTLVASSSTSPFEDKILGRIHVQMCYIEIELSLILLECIRVYYCHRIPSELLELRVLTQ